MTESGTHKRLKEEAKKQLSQMGMTKIIEEYRVYMETPCNGNNYRKGVCYVVDVAGFNDDVSIAVECGYCPPYKLQDLKKIFTEVRLIPYQMSRTATSITFSFRLDRELVERINNLIKQHYFDTKEEFVRRAIAEHLNRIEKPILA